MDQIKIGRFIAQRRKEKNLTQLQLAERLNITDRAISKWENGRSLPDASVMLELCRELGISVNELLTGEVLVMENYNENAEKQLLEMVKQKEEADKRLLAVEYILIGLSVVVIVAASLIAAYVNMPDYLRLIIVIAGVVLCLPGLFFSVKIEQVAGYYECGECGHRYVPSFSSALNSMHMGRTKYMRCPECGKRSWQKKVLSKDDK